MQCSLSAVELSLNEVDSRRLFALAAAVVLSSNHGLDAAACYPRRLKTAHGEASNAELTSAAIMWMA